MELDDFKAVWAREQKELESRLVLNERLVKQMTLEKSKGKFSKLLWLSILGRNLALVYMIISMVFAYWVIEELACCIPAIIGGLAMLFSYYTTSIFKATRFYWNEYHRIAKVYKSI